MNRNDKNASVVAVIDIGSSSLSMLVGQRVKGEIKILEKLESPVALGKDVFSTGEIGLTLANAACKAIENFVKIAREYKAGEIKAYATSAVREAKNKSFFIEQIKLRAGVDTQILDDMQEKTYIYKEITRFFKGYKIYKSPSLIVYMGVGNLGISCFTDGKIPYTVNIKMGSLRMSRIMTSIRDIEEDYQSVIEDYMRSFKETFFSRVKAGNFKHFIAGGKEAVTLYRLCKSELRNGLRFIAKDDFIKFYNGIADKTNEEISEKFDIEEEYVDSLKYTVTIYFILLNAINAPKIVIPDAHLSDGILYETLKKDDAKAFNAEFDRNSVISAENMAARYDYDKAHAETVKKYALKIFDKMKKTHGLGLRERLLLEIAAIAHDIGKYVSIKDHGDHSYDIIRSAELVGLSEEETQIIANVAKYHSSAIPSPTDSGYYALSPQKQMVVSKLAAIIRLAEALSKGHIKKFDDIEIKIKDDELFITVETLQSIKAEEWSFNIKSDYFGVVFGIRPKLVRRRSK